MKKILLAIFVICCLCACKTERQPAVHTQSLVSKSGCISNDWQFQYKGQWYPATVPGSIHTDLLANDLIPDPYYGTNEDSVQWVADSTWTYRLIFDADCSGDGAKYNVNWLVFDGLDTYAEVWLNGQLLESMNKEDDATMLNNMFRQWEFNVNDVLKDKGNELIVKFYPSVPMEEAAAAKLPYKMPDKRVFTRKAQYESGWDWGPKLITCGIWKNVRLESFNDMKLGNVFVYDSVPSFEKGKRWQTSVSLEVLSTSNKHEKVNVMIEVTDEDGLATKIEQKATLEPGENLIEVPVTIPNPTLWWPNGMGEQHLYTYSVTVQNKKLEDHAVVRHGLRTIELIREKDSIGESFAFKVNGKPFFARGADWIPASSYVGTLAANSDPYYRLLNDCKEVNMNMVRVWGGGIYEDDAFYNYCDELGLLVWQDFMFACNLYPADKAFLRNVDFEAIHQLKRLRNHPCIAVFCGNNEVHNGLEDWGWQTALGYDEATDAKLHQDYSKLFEELLANEVKEWSPKTPYVHSSPVFGWGHPECCTHGCSHYWGVWWGEQPFDVWKEKTGRFMSEYGFQSYPAMSTIETFATADQQNLKSPVMRNHQKHGRGVEIIGKAMEEELGMDTYWDLKEFSYRSQLVQALGIRRAIDAHRFQHDHCRGTLCWQVNDCWPVASWSSIDYTGRWKALHYQFKEAFQNVALCVDPQEKYSKADIYIVNDSLKDVSCELKWQILKMNGTPVTEVQSVKKKVSSDKSLKVLSLNIADYSKTANDVFAKVELFIDGKKHAERTLFFTTLGELTLPQDEIQQKVTYYADYAEITLTAKALHYGVCLETDAKTPIRYSDNYFVLRPNESKKIIAYYDPANLQDEKPKFTLKDFEPFKVKFVVFD